MGNTQIIGALHHLAFYKMHNIPSTQAPLQLQCLSRSVWVTEGLRAAVELQRETTFRIVIIIKAPTSNNVEHVHKCH